MKSDAGNEACHPYGDIASLEHESGNDSVEDRVLVAEIDARHALSLLSSAKTSEVLSGLGDNIVEELRVRGVKSSHLKLNSAGGLSTDGDVKENVRTRHFDSE